MSESTSTALLELYRSQHDFFKDKQADLLVSAGWNGAIADMYASLIDEDTQAAIAAMNAYYSSVLDGVGEGMFPLTSSECACIAVTPQYVGVVEQLAEQTPAIPLELVIAVAEKGIGCLSLSDELRELIGSADARFICKEAAASQEVAHA